MRNVQITLTFASILAAAGPALAGKVAVLPVTSINTPVEHEAVIGAIFAEAYASATGHEVVPPQQVGPVLTNAGSASAAAQELGCDEYVELSAVGLSSKIALRASRHTADGVGVHQVRMETTSLDDLAVVAERMATALANKTTVDETRGLHNVAGVETRSERRLFTESVYGFRLLSSAWVAEGEQLDPTFALEFVAKWEAGRMIVELGAGVFLPSMGWESAKKYGGLIMDLGASYYLLDGDVDLYAGGGVSPRMIGGDDDFGIRLALFGQLGVMFFRSTSTRLFIELRVAQHVVPFGGNASEYYDYTTYQWVSRTTDQFFPTEFTLGIGVGF